MMWFYIVAFIALFGLLLFGIAYATDYDRWPGLAIVLVATVITVVLAVFAYNHNLNYRHNKCEAWGRETNYEIKFVNIGYGDWDCYAKVDNNWIPTSKIRAIEE